MVGGAIGKASDTNMRLIGWIGMVAVRHSDPNPRAVDHVGRHVGKGLPTFIVRKMLKHMLGDDTSNKPLSLKHIVPVGALGNV